MISKCTTDAPIVFLFSSYVLVAPPLCGNASAKCANSGENYSFRRGSGLVQKRQLLLPLYDFGGRLSDEPPEGSREVGLVEIIEAANHVENGNSFPKQGGRASGALDL